MKLLPHKTNSGFIHRLAVLILGVGPAVVAVVIIAIIYVIGKSPGDKIAPENLDAEERWWAQSPPPPVETPTPDGWNASGSNRSE